MSNSSVSHVTGALYSNLKALLHYGITHTSKEQFAYQQGALITILQHRPCAHNTRSPLIITHTSKEQFAYQQGALITVIQHEPCLLIDLQTLPAAVRAGWLQGFLIPG